VLEACEAKQKNTELTETEKLLCEVVPFTDECEMGGDEE